MPVRCAGAGAGGLDGEICLAALKETHPVDDNEITAPENETEDLTTVRNMRSSRLGLLFILAITAAFAAPTSASLAQDPINDPSSAQYDAPIPGSGTQGASAASESDPGGLDAPLGSLPFTGMDLLILLGVACILVGTGFALRKLSSPRGPGV